MAQEDSVESFLVQAENAFAKGDRRTAAIMVNQVLNRDFINERAWRLLHQLLGSTQPFENFQIEFASKHYPDKFHLLPAAVPEWLSELDKAPATRPDPAATDSSRGTSVIGIGVVAPIPVPVPPVQLPPTPAAPLPPAPGMQTMPPQHVPAPAPKPPYPPQPPYPPRVPYPVPVPVQRSKWIYIGGAILLIIVAVVIYFAVHSSSSVDFCKELDCSQMHIRSQERCNLSPSQRAYGIEAMYILQVDLITPSGGQGRSESIVATKKPNGWSYSEDFWNGSLTCATFLN